MSAGDIAVIVMLVTSVVAMAMVYVAMALETLEETPQGDSDFPPLDWREYRGY